MNNNVILLVRDRWSEYEEILMDIDYSSFSYDYELNATRQLSFTAFKTPRNEFSYSLLTNEAVITYQGQDFVIKRCVPNVTGASQTKEVTAIHISLCVTDDHFQYIGKENPATYSLDDIMKFALQGNRLGITYEIIGNFANKRVDSISASNAKTIIKDIGCDLFGAILYADNKHLKMYSPDSWYRPSHKTYRYLYNTDDVSVTEDTTNLKTYIKAYGKEKEHKDAKTNKTVSTSNVTYNIGWISGGITKTKDSIAKFVFTGTGVDVHFRRHRLGGKVHIDVDGSNGKNGTTYNTKEGTLTLTIRGLEHKEHTCHIKFTGTDSKNPNTKTKGTATLELKNPIATIYDESVGDDRYEAVVTYESPASYQWGFKMAEPVTDNNITDKVKLLEFAKNQLQDYPELSLTLSYKDRDKEEIDVRDVWTLIHEPLGISSDVKLVSLKTPHPYTHESQEVVFSSARKDMAKIQNQFTKAMSNMTKSLRNVSYTVTSALPNIQEAYNAISAVSGNVDFDPERGIRTTRRIIIDDTETAGVSSMSDVRIMETVVDDGSVIIGDGTITSVGRDGTETDVVTPEGINLAATFGIIPSDRINITSPNGTKYALRVSDTGALSTVKVT